MDVGGSCQRLRPKMDRDLALASKCCSGDEVYGFAPRPMLQVQKAVWESNIP